MTPNKAIKITLYHDDLDKKVSTCNKSDAGPSERQKQYHTHYAPMILERWALPPFMAIGLCLGHSSCCLHWYWMCNLWDVLLPSRTWITGSAPFLFNSCTYATSVIISTIHTYHWQCPLKLNCYNANEREAIDTNDTWACPACVNLNENEKKERTLGSLKK